MELDFTSDEFHEIFIVGKPSKVFFSSGESLADTLVQMSRFFKTQPILPEWVSDGAILGVQGGTERVRFKNTDLSMQPSRFQLEM